MLLRVYMYSNEYVDVIEGTSVPRGTCDLVPYIK